MNEENLLNATKVKDYKCPKCKEFHTEKEEGYYVDGNHYPKYLNERRGSTMDGNYHDWDELHKCEKCKVEFYFNNGSY